ncbi:MAG TPA: glutamate mutase L, partial [Bacillota bacterium]|nr:glutamate mutase L [Bacillota bacterium]
MEIDALVAEIGSTTTVINAFTDLGTEHPRFLGSGYSPTTVVEGDVTIGLNHAIENLKKALG